MQWKEQSQGNITVRITNSHQGSQMEGWDIQGIEVNGRVPPTTRKGEFRTAEEAFAAGFQRGEDFEKEMKR